MSAAETKYNAQIQRVRELLGHVGRQHEVLLSKSLFGLLGSLLRSIKGCPESTLLANGNMAVLDDICAGKYVTLSKILQNVLANIYCAILLNAPGYAVRNSISSLLTIAQAKTTTPSGRESTIQILGLIVRKRAIDCGSLLSDLTNMAIKTIKSFDTVVRMTSLKCLTMMIIGAGGRLADHFPEIVKTATKYSSDKVPDMRLSVALLLTSVSEALVPGSPALVESISTVALKGMEDEVAAGMDHIPPTLLPILTFHIF